MAAGKIISAGIGAAAQGISMIGQRQRENRAMNNQKELMGIQNQGQAKLNKQGQELGMKTWHETNYGPQMEKMKEAGLNPAMMYGMSGGGGATAGSASGGSAASGSAPAPQGMDIGNMMLGAQMELMKAQSNKANAEAKSINGEPGTKGESEIDALIAGAATERERKGLVIAQAAVEAAKKGNIEQDTKLKEEQ